MGVYVGLVKAKGVRFDRIDDDEFMAHITDKNGNVVVTFEPREINVGETYKLDFGHEFAVATIKER